MDSSAAVFIPDFSEYLSETLDIPKFEETGEQKD